MFPEEFRAVRRTIRDSDYYLLMAGVGPPVLFLHGFPETHLCWDQVAPEVAAAHSVVTPDLRGYGSTHAPSGGPLGEGYAKRDMATELVELMATLGYDRFAVVGHDRGARVAYRMALDHPEAVSQLAVLNIVPTVDQFEQMDRGPSLGYWPWFLLAQAAPFPERLLSADPDAMLDHVFDNWPADPRSIDAAHREAYRAAMTPSVIAAMCADYRASFHVDRQHDTENRAAECRIKAPTLVVIGTEETQLHDAPATWAAWTENVQAAQVPAGHFLPEEAPQQLIDLLAPFLESADR
jgi:haloacetate dehalogenase